MGSSPVASLQKIKKIPSVEMGFLNENYFIGSTWEFVFMVAVEIGYEFDVRRSGVFE